MDYKLYAEDPDDPDNLGYIANIKLDDYTNWNGKDICVSVENTNRADGYGARNLGAINLDANGTENGYIYRIVIAGDLGRASGNVNVQSAIHTEVAGDLIGDFSMISGSAGSLTVNGDVYGDISGTDITATIGGSCYGDISTLSCSTITIGGDLRGSLGVRTLSSNNSIYIAGDVIDTGDNHIWIENMTNAEFECNTLQSGLVGGTTGRFNIGTSADYTEIRSGQVVINGVLSGRIRVYGRSQLQFTIGEINAGAEPGSPSDGLYGGVEFAGQCLSDSSVDVTGNLTQGRIAYGRAVATADRGPMLGSINVAGNVGANAIIGTQHIRWDATVTYEVDPCDVAADITIGGDCAGDILSTKDFTSDASITINGDVASTARIETIGAYGSAVGSIDCPIHIDGDCDGDILARDDLGADVRIDGQFQQNAAIDITGAKDAGVMILINDDGGPTIADRLWHDDATVAIGATTYENDSAGVNTAAANVWYICAFKGDMNHDCARNAFDIDPFVFALADGVGYLATYPQLTASLRFRGDCNCDCAFNSFDIDPFVDLLVNGVQCEDSCDLELQRMMLGGGFDDQHANDPQTLAGVLYASVTPTNLTAFQTVLAADTAELPEGPERTYWETLLTELANLAQ